MTETQDAKMEPQRAQKSQRTIQESLKKGEGHYEGREAREEIQWAEAAWRLATMGCTMLVVCESPHSSSHLSTSHVV